MTNKRANKKPAAAKSTAAQSSKAAKSPKSSRSVASAAKTVVLTPQTLAEGLAFLQDADPTMRRLIARNRPLKLYQSEPPFTTLATSIINQQLSQKAADTIEARLRQLMPLTAAGVRATAPQALRDAGLSWSKVKFLNNLAEADAAGILDRRRLLRCSDDEIISHLTSIKGIGRWTAEMFLMFGMRRADVLSLGDVGLLRGARINYPRQFKRLGDERALLEQISNRWRPWRTIACWHLWRSLEG